MSSDDEEMEIPVAAVAAEDEADRAPTVPVQLSKVTMTAWKRDSAGRLTTLHLKMIRMVQVFPKWT